MQGNANLSQQSYRQRPRPRDSVVSSMDTSSHALTRQAAHKRNAQRESPMQQPNQHSDTQKQYMNIKSHGNSAAIEIAPDATVKHWSTIRIEGAKKKNAQSREYDWNNKVAIQITKTELPVVIGTLLGYLPRCEYRNHGGEAGKWLSIENQGNNFFIRVGQIQPKALIPCPVPMVEAHLMGMLALSQYVKNFENITADAALEAIKVMCAHMNKISKSNEQAGQGKANQQR